MLNLFTAAAITGLILAERAFADRKLYENEQNDAADGYDYR